jgi:tetratricopeptide (TPR) repeat protein
MEIDQLVSEFIAELPEATLPESTRGTLLAAVGLKLQERFLRTGSKDDLDRAITMEEEAIASTPDDHSVRAGYLNNLGNVLQRRFELTGSMNDLDRAITTIEQAISSTPNNHPNHAMYLSNLGSALRSRFELTGSMSDLDRAIMTNGQAVESTPDDHQNRGMYLNNLGSALHSRYQRTGLLDDLGRAITANEQAVESTPNDHPVRAGYLNNLGLSLQSRFQRMGSMDDLDRVILTNEQVVESTPDNHADHAIYLDNLGNALQIRFERTGSMDDLDRVIKAKEQAVESTPNDHPNRGRRLKSLGNALQSRFERAGSISDLDRVIKMKEQAVASCPDGHPDRATWLNNLGNAYQTRFQRTGSMDDLDRAIAVKEQAVESIPHGPNCAGLLNNLGNAYQSRFERTGSMDDLDRAIMTKEQAVASTPYNHPDCARLLNDLGDVYECRFKHMGSMDDLDRAITTKEQAVASNVAAPSIRLRAAQSCSDLLIKQGVYDRAKPILQTAVRLLPMISPRVLKHSDRQYNISQFANITSRAVSLALLDGEDPYHSLQLLELGRGILAHSRLEVRSHSSVLATSHPDLARTFLELQYQIDPPLAHTDSPVGFGSSASESSISAIEHRALMRKFDDLLRYIRSLNGYENFLLDPSESELHHLAEGGPIVVFNISDIRSDAFLITPDEIRTLHLPLLTSESLEHNIKRFLSAIHDSQNLDYYRHSIRTLNAVLRWLWDVAVSPILDELGFTQTPSDGEPWPRVWWVGSGLLNILPIHASGYHDSIPPQTALDRVISSYAPTVKSLSHAWERARADQVKVKEKALLISMPKTPEKDSLPFADIEVENLRKLFSNASISTTIMHNPTTTEVLSELPKHSIVHFACHAYPANDPSQSSLLLEDWKNVPLTVLDLASLNIKSAKFAYLSACHTSSMQDFNLLDESITLSSAIQLSGYPSVVGSLWQVMDNHSADVAKRIYTWILDGDGGFDCLRTAEGLHKAVSILRDHTRVKMQNNMMNDPLIWASYIHVGI